MLNTNVKLLALLYLILSFHCVQTCSNKRKPDCCCRAIEKRGQLSSGRTAHKYGPCHAREHIEPQREKEKYVDTCSCCDLEERACGISEPVEDHGPCCECPQEIREAGPIRTKCPTKKYEKVREPRPCECNSDNKNVIGGLFTRVCTNFYDKINKASECDELYYNSRKRKPDTTYTKFEKCLDSIRDSEIYQKYRKKEKPKKKRFIDRCGSSCRETREEDKASRMREKREREEKRRRSKWEKRKGCMFPC